MAISIKVQVLDAVKRNEWAFEGKTGISYKQNAIVEHGLFRIPQVLSYTAQNNEVPSGYVPGFYELGADSLELRNNRDSGGMTFGLSFRDPKLEPLSKKVA